MSEIFKREVVFLVTGIVTVIMFIDFFFFPAGWDFAETLRTWAVIVFNISLGLGAVFLLRSHTMNVQKKGRNWYYSGWLLVAFAVMLLTGLAGYAATGSQSGGNAIYDWLFTHIYTPLGATLYAITGFYIFSAAYRAFRARNIDAALMLIAGCFVILSNAPVGEVIWSGIPTIGEWFRFTGQIPGMRTLALTVALGMLAYGFRALLGKERGFYAGVGEE
jgi:F0F1-type ATP synthase membrane subunit a